MVKVVRFRFQQYLVPFTILLVEASSETGLFFMFFIKHIYNVTKRKVSDEMVNFASKFRLIEIEIEMKMKILTI